MSAPRAFRLAPGGTGPLQQSRVSCGAACLTVARMMIDPQLTAWILKGLGGAGAEPDPRAPAERFAAQERAVLSRTNALRLPGAGGSWQLPWPTALGTPPWGALHELQERAACPGTRYEIGMLRGAQPDLLRGMLEHVSACVADGAPALLYVGNAALPRHVLLVYTDGRHPGRNLYDPADGRAMPFPLDALAEGRCRLSGWETPWLSVHPYGQQRVGESREVFSSWPSRVLARLPAPGALARHSGH